MQFNQGVFYPNLLDDSQISRVVQSAAYPVIQYLTAEYDVYVTESRYHETDFQTVTIMCSKEGFYVFKIVCNNKDFVTVWNHEYPNGRKDFRKIAESDNIRYLIKRLNKLKDDDESKWGLGKVKDVLSIAIKNEIANFQDTFFNTISTNDLLRYEYNIDRVLKETLCKYLIGEAKKEDFFNADFESLHRQLATEREFKERHAKTLNRLEQFFSEPMWLVGYRHADEQVTFGKVDMSYILHDMKYQFRMYSRQTFPAKDNGVKQIEPLRVYKSLQDIPNKDPVLATMTFNKIAYSKPQHSAGAALGKDGLILSRNYNTIHSYLSIYDEVGAFAWTNSTRVHWAEDSTNWYMFGVR